MLELDHILGEGLGRMTLSRCANELINTPSVRLQAHWLAADDARAPAEQCDEVISNLQKSRSKYVRAQAPYGNITWAKQFKLWAGMVRRDVRVSHLK